MKSLKRPAPDTRQPSLFDDPAPGIPDVSLTHKGVTTFFDVKTVRTVSVAPIVALAAKHGIDLKREWQEVPAARFLSWPENQQLRYCAVRDRDSAARCDDPEMRTWYLERAEAYEAMTTSP